MNREIVLKVDVDEDSVLREIAAIEKLADSLSSHARGLRFAISAEHTHTQKEMEKPEV